MLLHSWKEELLLLKEDLETRNEVDKEENFFEIEKMIEDKDLINEGSQDPQI